jgi:hypothetical protein
VRGAGGGSDKQRIVSAHILGLPAVGLSCKVLAHFLKGQLNERTT